MVKRYRLYGLGTSAIDPESECRGALLRVAREAYHGEKFSYSLAPSSAGPGSSGT